MKIITLDNLKYALGLVNTKIHNQWTTFTGLLNGKVDIVEGKGLSTNDFTNDAKSKLEEVDKKAAGINNITISEAGVMTVKNAHDDESNKATVTVYASAASKLSTARSINGVPFDGTENIVIPGGGTNDTSCAEEEILSLFSAASSSSADGSGRPSSEDTSPLGMV